MIDFKKLTSWLVPSLIMALIIYDVVAIKFGTHASISQWIWDNNDANPIIGFGLGLLMGHFFFPRVKAT
jgi:hypothetical protein